MGEFILFLSQSQWHSNSFLLTEHGPQENPCWHFTPQFDNEPQDNFIAIGQAPVVFAQIPDAMNVVALALMRFSLGNYQEAASLTRQSIDILRNHHLADYQENIGKFSALLSSFYLCLSDFEGALQAGKESVSIFEALPEQEHVLNLAGALMSCILAQVALQGYGEMSELSGRCIALLTRCGFQPTNELMVKTLFYQQFARNGLEAQTEELLRDP